MAKNEKTLAASVAAVKGFATDLSCRGFKFEAGKTYSVEGAIKACENGFHACPEHPLDVFEFYPPATSIYHAVEQSGEIDESHRPQKLASASITIGVQISVHDLIARAVKYVFDRAKPSKGSTSDEENGAASSTGYRGAASSTGDHGAASSTGDYGAASSTGDYGAASSTGVRGAASSTGARGAASSTGYQGAASSTGDYGAASSTGARGAASSTGDYGAASSTGYQGAASSTGDYGAASSTGEKSVAMATGYEGKARAAKSGAICLVCRDDNGNIVAIRASKVGENGVKPMTWYALSAEGEFIETTAPTSAVFG